MISLYFDTESSGLWRDKLPDEHESQPHLLQLAAKLVTDDGKCVGRMNRIIRPDGWSIEPGAEDIHKISERQAYRVGGALAPALILFQDFVASASRIVAFSIEFDRRMIARAIFEAGGNGLWWRKRSREYVCAKETSAAIVGLPGKFGEAKWPTLEEAHDFFYPELAPYISTHDAEADVDACARIDLAVHNSRALASSSRSA